MSAPEARVWAAVIASCSLIFAFRRNCLPSSSREAVAAELPELPEAPDAAVPELPAACATPPAVAPSATTAPKVVRAFIFISDLLGRR